MLVHYFPYSAWEEFRDLIPENERGCFVNAYHKRLNSDNLETQVRFLFWFFIYAFFLNDKIFPKKKLIPAVKLCVRACVSRLLHLHVAETFGDKVVLSTCP